MPEFFLYFLAIVSWCLGFLAGLVVGASILYYRVPKELR